MSPDGSRGRDLTSRLLAGVDPEVQRMIIAEGALRKLRPGQVLCRMDEPAEHLYVLLKGRVQLSRASRSGHDVLVSVLVPGDVFGLVCLLTRRATYMGTAEAMEAGEAMVWDRATVQRLARPNPQLTANALTIALAMVAQFAARHEALIDSSAPGTPGACAPGPRRAKRYALARWHRRPHQERAVGGARRRQRLYGQSATTAVGTRRRSEKTTRCDPHRRSGRAFDPLNPPFTPDVPHLYTRRFDRWPLTAGFGRIIGRSHYLQSLSGILLLSEPLEATRLLWRNDEVHRYA
jgi:CRP-like cAMP-binding protein